MSCHRVALYWAGMLDMTCQIEMMLWDMTCHRFWEVSGHGMPRFVWVERVEVDVACQGDEVDRQVDLAITCHPDLA